MPYLVNHLLPKLARNSLFESNLGKQLPSAYMKFWHEWRERERTPVVYTPIKSEWERDPVTGEMKRFQDIPIPLKFTKEMGNMLLGGEGIVQGFKKKDYKKRGKYKDRVAAFWIPHVRRGVVQSEVLNKNFSVLFTDRVVHLIHQNHGFDHYILKTPACDLVTLLALKFKRTILHELKDRCPSLNEDPEKQAEVYNKYKDYLSAYTDDEIEWYGLSYNEAISKLEKELQEKNKPQPMKHMYRKMLIEKLNAAKEEELMNNQVNDNILTKIKSLFVSRN